ncbi:MAG: LytR C-terminal domain-containing protein [Patescibacteria group bacterium]
MKKIIVAFLSVISLVFLMIVFYAFFSNLETENIIFTHKTAEAKGDKLIILRANTIGKNLSLEFFSINAGQKSKLLGSYGEYSLRAIYPLLKLDEKNNSYINAAFSYSLRILVKQVIALERVPEIESQSQVKQLFLDLCLDRYGKISFEDKFKLLRLLFRVDNLAVEVENIDKPEELNLDEDSAGCSVSLINTTQKNGLGRDMANLIEKNGFRVVKIDDDSETREESMVILARNESNCKELSGLLYTILPSDKKPKFDESLFSQYRADIVVLLGTDLLD